MSKYMELARQIQDDVNNPSIDINTILRKCKILAAQLADNKFKLWVERELNGYEDRADLPHYRVRQQESYGDFEGYFGRRIVNQQIPSSCIPKKYREFATTGYLMQPISHYAALLSEESDRIGEVWPGDIVAHIGSNIIEGMTLTRAWKPLPKNAISTILDIVRNNILEYLLNLKPESADIKDDEQQLKDVGLPGKTGEESKLLIEISESLYESLSRIPNADEQGYIQEALACLDDRVKAYRAAVLMGWAGTIYHLRKKVEVIGFARFCQTYEALSLGKPKHISHIDDLEFCKDKDFLLVVERMGILDKAIREQLENCLDLRNACGHPTQVAPKIHRVKAFFEDIIEYALSR